MAFCPRCGTQVEADAKFCPACGSPLSRAQEPPQPSPPQWQTPQPQQPYQQQGYAPQMHAPQPQVAVTSGKPEYQTLGGWLLFFVIVWGLNVLATLPTLYLRLSSFINIVRFDASYALPGIIGILGALVGIAGYVFIIVLVVKRNHQFLKLLQLLTIVNIVLSIAPPLLQIGSAIQYESSAALANIIGTSVGTLIGGAVGLLLSTLYFSRSERVRTYMGSEAYLNNALFTLRK